MLPNCGQELSFGGTKTILHLFYTLVGEAVAFIFCSISSFISIQLMPCSAFHKRRGWWVTHDVFPLPCLRGRSGRSDWMYFMAPQCVRCAVICDGVCYLHDILNLGAGVRLWKYVKQYYICFMSSTAELLSSLWEVYHVRFSFTSWSLYIGWWVFLHCSVRSVLFMSPQCVQCAVLCGGVCYLHDIINLKAGVRLWRDVKQHYICFMPSMAELLPSLWEVCRVRFPFTPWSFYGGASVTTPRQRCL